MAVLPERLRENLSFIVSSPDPEWPPLSSQGPREFFNVTRGCEDGILCPRENQRCAHFPASRRILTPDPSRGTLRTDRVDLADRPAAKAVGERQLTEHVPLLEQTLEEEKETDEKLSQLAEQINLQAQEEAEGEEEGEGAEETPRRRASGNRSRRAA